MLSGFLFPTPVETHEQFDSRESLKCLPKW
jgi:hypothetical protein